MKHRELHWETASDKQKMGYLLSALGMKPDNYDMTFGKQFGYFFKVSEEQMLKVPFPEAVGYLRSVIKASRARFIEEYDQVLATLAEIEAL